MRDGPTASLELDWINRRTLVIEHLIRKQRGWEMLLEIRNCGGEVAGNGGMGGIRNQESGRFYL